MHISLHLLPRLIAFNATRLIRNGIMSSSSDEETELQPKGQSSSKESGSTTSKASASDTAIEKIRQFFTEKLNLYTTGEEAEEVLETVDVHGVVKAWKAGKFRKIVTMVGAGISTSAGIPDFRSPSTGLYSNLLKYDLPYPEAIFDLTYFRKNPKPFFQLAKELYPGTFKPTPSHYFVKLLHDKGLLIRHYTQNIDTLERLTDLPEEKIVEAHGTFYKNHCIQCAEEYSMEWMKEEIFADRLPACAKCEGVVKPDIVFFGENLPEKFHTLPNQDFKECDLLIIMGTSLTVQPFAGLVDYVSDSCVRLLINRDKVGSGMGLFQSLMFGQGLCFDLPGNRRDVAWQGDCDDGVQFLADQLGFGEELRELVKREHARIDAESTAEDKEKTSSEAKVEKTEKDEKEEANSADGGEEAKKEE